MTATPEIKNAIIRSVSLGIEDHGILTCYLHLNYGGGGQGFGGFTLDGPIRDANGEFLGRCGTAWGMEFIRRVLETVGVSDWEKLPGTAVRVETEGWGGVALRLGHFIDNRWFDPKADLAHLLEKKS